MRRPKSGLVLGRRVRVREGEGEKRREGGREERG
jgi:hypothetical protein